MSLRGIHLGITLDFGTEEESAESEKILMMLIGAVCRHNFKYLQKNPEVPLLYNSGVKYLPPEQTDARLNESTLKNLSSQIKASGLDQETANMAIRILEGIETFLDIPALYRRGGGDCNELVPVRVAELWRAGIKADPWLVNKVRNRNGGYTYHLMVRWPDGSGEDPSLILGMGGKARAADRAEEIRKNKERFGNYIAAAQHLIEAEGASPIAVGKQIDLLGLIPRRGKAYA